MPGLLHRNYLPDDPVLSSAATPEVFNKDYLDGCTGAADAIGRHLGCDVAHDRFPSVQNRNLSEVADIVAWITEEADSNYFFRFKNMGARSPSHEWTVIKLGAIIEYPQPPDNIFMTAALSSYYWPSPLNPTYNSNSHHNKRTYNYKPYYHFCFHFNSTMLPVTSIKGSVPNCELIHCVTPLEFL